MQISEGAEVLGLDVCPTKLVDPDRVASVRERLVGLDLSLGHLRHDEGGRR